MYNIYIRPLKIEDALISYKWRNDPEVWKFTGAKPNKEITWEIEKEWLNKVLLDNTTKRFAIIVDKEYVGNIQLTNITQKKGVYHIFIGNKKFWGKGVAQQATFLILNYAKRILKLEEINLEVQVNNISAYKLYLKCGFFKEGEKDGWVKMSYLIKDILPITVSVFIMVYNHEKYLHECINGILKQKVNFNIEIIVGEDSSTDSSRQILLDYQEKYPGRFNLILHKENIGARANQEIVFNNCTGKYIAMCEGDDYWTDPHKLQKQVDFLEANDDCNLVYHRVKIYDEEKKTFSPETLNKSLTIQKRTIQELSLGGNFIHTPSVLFRNNLTIPTRLFNLPVGDYILWFLNGEKGNFGYLPDEMAVYRFSEKSTWGKKSDYYRIFNWLKVLLSLKQYSKNIIIKELFKKQAWVAYKELKIMTIVEKFHIYKILLKIEPRFIKRILLNKS